MMTATLNQNLLEKCKKDILISSVIGRYTETKINGDNVIAKCLFHEDENVGSFVASNSKGIFKCFSCGISGDAIKFVALKENLTHMEAAYKLGLDHNLITQSDYDAFCKDEEEKQGESAMMGVSRRLRDEEILGRKQKEAMKTLTALTTADDAGIRSSHLVEPLLNTYGFVWTDFLERDENGSFERFGVEKPSAEVLSNFERAHVWFSESLKLAVITFDYGNGNAGFAGEFTTAVMQKMIENVK